MGFQLTEHVDLGEGTDDPDLITEDLGGRPGDAVGAGVDTVYDEGTAATAVVDGVLEELDRTGGLDDCRRQQGQH